MHAGTVKPYSSPPPEAEVLCDNNRYTAFMNSRVTVIGLSIISVMFLVAMYRFLIISNNPEKTIRGYVRDELNNAPLKGVKVALVGRKESDVTNNEGLFVIRLRDSLMTLTIPSPILICCENK